MTTLAMLDSEVIDADEAEFQRMAREAGVTLLPVDAETEPYPGPRKLCEADAYSYTYRTYEDVAPRFAYKSGKTYGGQIDREKSVGYGFVDVPATEPADAFAGITREDYDAYMGRIKISRTGVVTAVKVRRAPIAKPKVSKCCPHCGGAL